MQVLATIAQLVEQRPCKPMVRGSIPRGGTNFGIEGTVV